MAYLHKLTAGPACLELAPAMGGGIARLDVSGTPVLRPWNGDEDDPFSLACNVLMPFANRISGGGFTWNGTFYPLSPNREGEPHPLHGDGFLRPWDITQTGTFAQMTLANGAIGPWTYRAQQNFLLTPDRLEITVRLTNIGVKAMPFGLGLHPWFPRSAATRLSFLAKTVWLENASYLPDKELDLTDAPEWAFARARSLPPTWINNCYTGWSGVARIDQGDAAMSCTISCDGAFDHAHVFSPGATSDFLCFEPVSHPVDSLNLPGQPGLRVVSPGGALQASVVLSWG